MKGERIAVVLFNLGGPDSLDAVEPFLFNLFSDRAIIDLPGPIRWLVAKVISGRRAKIAREIYGQIGGSSPLLAMTVEQAKALERRLVDLGEVHVSIAMRYWHPLSGEAAAEVAAFRPNRIVLLPLYPQFSTTTTGSSFEDWFRSARKAGLKDVPSVKVCCYPTNSGFVAAHADVVRGMLEKVPEGERVRILFSAHGLPKKIIARGDPYQWQVQRTVEAIVGRMSIPDLDWVVCYQSRVGPLEWIGPSTEEEIKRAGEDGVSVVVSPVAFVSEHSETLVELDKEYRTLADEAGVQRYLRAPALGTAEAFIDELGRIVRTCASSEGVCAGGGESRLCPEICSHCPNRRGRER